jgi:hypothetical protein
VCGSDTEEADSFSALGILVRYDLGVGDLTLLKGAMLCVEGFEEGEGKEEGRKEK